MRHLRAALTILSLLLAASPAGATCCSAEVVRLASGPLLLWGSTDEPLVQSVVLTDSRGVMVQYMAVQGMRFADLMSFRAEPGSELRAVFVGAGSETLCVHRLAIPPAGAPVVGEGGLLPGGPLGTTLAEGEDTRR